jgi:hypothetical protein
MREISVSARPARMLGMRAPSATTVPVALEMGGVTRPAGRAAALMAAQWKATARGDDENNGRGMVDAETKSCALRMDN